MARVPDSSSWNQNKVCQLIGIPSDVLPREGYYYAPQVNIRSITVGDVILAVGPGDTSRYYVNCLNGVPKSWKVMFYGVSDESYGDSANSTHIPDNGTYGPITIVVSGGARIVKDNVNGNFHEGDHVGIDTSSSAWVKLVELAQKGGERIVKPMLTPVSGKLRTTMVDGISEICDPNTERNYTTGSWTSGQKLDDVSVAGYASKSLIQEVAFATMSFFLATGVVKPGPVNLSRASKDKFISELNKMWADQPGTFTAGSDGSLVAKKAPGTNMLSNLDFIAELLNMGEAGNEPSVLPLLSQMVSSSAIGHTVSSVSAVLQVAPVNHGTHGYLHNAVKKVDEGSALVEYSKTLEKLVNGAPLVKVIKVVNSSEISVLLR